MLFTKEKNLSRHCEGAKKEKLIVLIKKRDAEKYIIDRGNLNKKIEKRMKKIILFLLRLLRWFFKKKPPQKNNRVSCLEMVFVVFQIFSLQKRD